jgi:transcription termination factor NusB
MEVVKMAYNDLLYIHTLARSLVYQGLYDALQKILGGGATKEVAEKLILEVCHSILDNKENLSAILEEKRDKHPHLACSLVCQGLLVYQGLYDALQKILGGGATKEDAEKLILEVCHSILDNKENLSAILEEKRDKHPLSSKDALLSIFKTKNSWRWSNKRRC